MVYSTINNTSIQKCFISNKNLCLIFSSPAVLGPYSKDGVIIRPPNI